MEPGIVRVIDCYCQHRLYHFAIAKAMVAVGLIALRVDRFLAFKYLIKSAKCSGRVLLDLRFHKYLLSIVGFNLDYFRRSGK
jgi:hypothetical protein